MLLCHAAPVTRPKKKRGFRSIVVDGSRYQWRFKPGATHSELLLCGARVANGALFRWQLADWRDPWLCIDGFAIEGDRMHLSSAARNEPRVVSPAWVSEAVRAALHLGWRADQPGPTQAGVFRDGAFGPVSMRG
jgi:hypothetical protein